MPQRSLISLHPAAISFNHRGASSEAGAQLKLTCAEGPTVMVEPPTLPVWRRR